MKVKFRLTEELGFEWNFSDYEGWQECDIADVYAYIEDVLDKDPEVITENFDIVYSDHMDCIESEPYFVVKCDSDEAGVHYYMYQGHHFGPIGVSFDYFDLTEVYIDRYITIPIWGVVENE